MHQDRAADHPYRFYITSLSAIGAFAVAEQPGVVGLAGTAFLVTRQQFTDHRVLQEITLEPAALAILHNEAF